MDRSDILQITELLSSRQSLFHSLDSMLSRILVSLNTGVVAFRTKALRALGLIVVNDPSVLGQVGFEARELFVCKLGSANYDSKIKSGVSNRKKFTIRSSNGYRTAHLRYATRPSIWWAST